MYFCRFKANFAFRIFAAVEPRWAGVARGFGGRVDRGGAEVDGREVRWRSFGARQVRLAKNKVGVAAMAIWAGAGVEAARVGIGWLGTASEDGYIHAIRIAPGCLRGDRLLLVSHC